MRISFSLQELQNEISLWLNFANIKSCLTLLLTLELSQKTLPDITLSKSSTDLTICIPKDFLIETWSWKTFSLTSFWTSELEISECLPETSKARQHVLELLASCLWILRTERTIQAKPLICSQPRSFYFWCFLEDLHGLLQDWAKFQNTRIISL